MDAMTDAITGTVTIAPTTANNSVVSAAPPTSTAAQTRTDATMSNESNESNSRATLAAAVLGFFIITLDAVVVNVALPSIRHDLGGGVTGLQWVVDGYTLMFASLLLSAGSLTDRIGARCAFGTGLGVFVVASAACGAAPNLFALVVARFVQGGAAAMMMPASMALVRQAFPEAKARGRAVGVWAMGGAVASSSGPLLGGALSVADWRFIFLLNVPVGIVAALLVRSAGRSPRRATLLDWAGQATGIVAMAGLTYTAIEAGAGGFTQQRVMIAVAITVVALAVFVLTQARGQHPMMPSDLFANRTAVIVFATGFAFMVGYYGLPFVFSLYLQQQRALSAFGTGLVFLPMMLIGAALTPLSARITEKIGRKAVIVAGLALMTIGLAVLGVLPSTTPLWLLAVLMMFVGMGGPTISPPGTALLLDVVAHERTGTASGVFNTSRQVGGALAVAVFGGLLSRPESFMRGVHTSLLLAAAVLALTTIAALFLNTHFRPGAPS
jgi:MFS transporter, DHA2 family, methylenomycin A resistance protein